MVSRLIVGCTEVGIGVTAGTVANQSGAVSRLLVRGWNWRVTSRVTALRHNT